MLLFSPRLLLALTSVMSLTLAYLLVSAAIYPSIQLYCNHQMISTSYQRHETTQKLKAGMPRVPGDVLDLE